MKYADTYLELKKLFPDKSIKEVSQMRGCDVLDALRQRKINREGINTFGFGKVQEFENRAIELAEKCRGKIVSVHGFNSPHYYISEMISPDKGFGLKKISIFASMNGYLYIKMIMLFFRSIIAFLCSIALG